MDQGDGDRGDDARGDFGDDRSGDGDGDGDDHDDRVAGACKKLSAGKYQCTFYPPGDGITGGSPVQSANGNVVGYLNQGHNWIICQASGATVHSGQYYNRWWGYTEANDHKMGRQRRLDQPLLRRRAARVFPPQ